MEESENNLYEVMINDEGFLNDIWDDYDATTKYQILEKSGCDMVKEWEEYQKRNNQQLEL